MRKRDEYREFVCLCCLGGEEKEYQWGGGKGRVLEKLGMLKQVCYATFVALLEHLVCWLC